MPTAIASLYKRSVRFGVAAGTSASALAIAGVALGYASVGHRPAAPVTTTLPAERMAHAMVDGVPDVTPPLPRAEGPPAFPSFGSPLDPGTVADWTPSPTATPAPTAVPPAPPPPSPPPIAARTAVAPPAPTPVPDTTGDAPVRAASADLYTVIAGAFPEQPDFAYRVAMCESAGNPAVNTGNGYYGLWQFDLATWRSVGGGGLPSDAPLPEQVQRARALYERRGWAPWSCA